VWDWRFSMWALQTTANQKSNIVPRTSVLPDAFLDRLRTIVPPEHYDAVAASFAAPQATGFRVNTLRAEASSVLDALRDGGLHPHAADGIPGGFWVEAAERAALLDGTPYAEGHVYVQNLASQLPPLVLDPQPGETVLDLCAAPGSKTRQLATLMQDEGRIVAVEVVRKRYYKLRDNLAQQGSTLAEPVCANGAGFWHRSPEAFDRVLLDAPCSTEGRFRTDTPETTRYWSRRKIKEMRSKQQKLLFSGIQALRPGGTLVYSTCTFAPEENEAVLAKALRTFGDAIELLPVTLDGEALALPNTQPTLSEWNGRAFPDEVGAAVRVLPSATMEAFFVAKLTKHASTLRG
ncbi:MAG: RsmB/NOP family class I SAM-dependent RNA methyltransferase, partial [Bacteroidota bacterium]